jgi:hypothetical protein
MRCQACPETPKSKLSDTALLILNTAADRKDRLVFPLPESLTSSGKQAEKAVKELLARKLIEECPAKLGDVIWRTDEQQRHLTLRVTTGGKKTLAEPKVTAEAAAPSAEPTQSAASRRRKAQRTKAPEAKASNALSSRHKQATKAERILILLRRSQGATITELIKSTGWQAHSIRGFMSATLKSKMKLKLKSDRPEGKERRYRVA